VGQQEMGHIIVIWSLEIIHVKIFAERA